MQALISNWALKFSCRLDKFGDSDSQPFAQNDHDFTASDEFARNIDLNGFAHSLVKFKDAARHQFKQFLNGDFNPTEFHLSLIHSVRCV